MLAFLTIIDVVGQEKVAHKALIHEYLKTREGKTNRDIIPSAVWHLFARPAVAAAGL